jgi:hypothetical protein
MVKNPSRFSHSSTRLSAKIAIGHTKKKWEEVWSDDGPVWHEARGQQDEFGGANVVSCTAVRRARDRETLKLGALADLILCRDPQDDVAVALARTTQSLEAVDHRSIQPDEP